MTNNIVFITVNEKKIVKPINESEKIIVYDSDKHEIVGELNNPYNKGFWILEELFDEHDPALLISGGMDEETKFMIEENGVKVIITKQRELEEVINEYFG